MAMNINKIRMVDTKSIIARHLLAAEEFLLRSNPEDGIMVSTLLSCVVDACMMKAGLCEFDINYDIDPGITRRWQFILYADESLRLGAYKMLPMTMFEYKDIIDQRIDRLNQRARSEAALLPDRI